MARNFAGADYVRCGIGNLATITGSTMAAIVRRTSINTFDTIVGCEHAGSAIPRVTMMLGDVTYTNRLLWLTGGNARDIPLSVLDTDGWCLVAAKKATGSAIPRGSRYVYATNTWSHANAASTVTDSSDTADRVNLGTWYAAGYEFVGDIAIAAAWKRVLTDAEIEQLAFSLPAWQNSMPDGAWLLDQSLTTQNVIDWSGNGANQTSVTATAVSTSSVPGFGYVHPVLTSRRIGALTITGSATLSAQSTLTADADVIPRVLDWHWYGSLVYSTVEERDRAYERINDMMQATVGSEPHPDPYYGTGLEKQTTGHVGESEGPGVTWSFRLADALLFDAEVLAGDLRDYALDGQTGSAQLDS